MTYTGPSDQMPVQSYNVVGDTGRLDYQINGRGNFLGPLSDGGNNVNLEIDLARDVPITSLNIQAGATDARIDLSDLRVNNLDMMAAAPTPAANPNRREL